MKEIAKVRMEDRECSRKLVKQVEREEGERTNERLKEGI